MKIDNNVMRLETRMNTSNSSKAVCIYNKNISTTEKDKREIKIIDGKSDKASCCKNLQ